MLKDTQAVMRHGFHLVGSWLTLDNIWVSTWAHKLNTCFGSSTRLHPNWGSLFNTLLWDFATFTSCTLNLTKNESHEALTPPKPLYQWESFVWESSKKVRFNLSYGCVTNFTSKLLHEWRPRRCKNFPLTYTSYYLLVEIETCQASCGCKALSQSNNIQAVWVGNALGELDQSKTLTVENKTNYFCKLKD